MARQLTGFDRSRWALSLLLAACGGRARSDDAAASHGPSMQSDAGRGSVTGAGAAPDVGNDDVGGGAANAGGNAQSGSANAGGQTTSGGAGEAGDGGEAGATGDPPEVVAACSKLCEELSACPEQDGAGRQSCARDCANEAIVDNTACIPTSVDMLSCLTSTLHASANGCSDRFALAMQACDVTIQAHRRCGTPREGSKLCVHVSIAGPEAGTITCMDDLKCLDGQIRNLKCVAAPDAQSRCSCFSKLTRYDTVVNEPTLELCKNRFDECLATGMVAP